jgi:hypothetical protein
MVKFRSLNEIESTREENIERFSNCILSNKHIENVESNLIEKVAYNLIDKRSSIISGRKSSHVSRKYKLF